MINRQFLFSSANNASMILFNLNAIPVKSRKVSACTIFQSSAPRFHGLGPSGMFATKFFIIQKATTLKFFFWQTHRFPMTFLGAKSVFLRLLVRVKLFMADFTNAINYCRSFSITFYRTILISLLGYRMSPCFATGETSTHFGSSFLLTFMRTIFSLADSTPGRKGLEGLTTMDTFDYHGPSILNNHWHVKRFYHPEERKP